MRALIFNHELMGEPVNAMKLFLRLTSQNTDNLIKQPDQPNKQKVRIRFVDLDINGLTGCKSLGLLSWPQVCEV